MRATIRLAKKTAEIMRARQVVICAFDSHGKMAVVSYGITPAECKDIRPLCDSIADGILAGHLPAPEINR